MSCSKIKETNYGEVTDHDWDLLTGKSEHIRFNKKEDFLNEVNEYIKAISKYLDKLDWLDQYDSSEHLIEFKYSSNGSHVAGGYYHKYSPRLEVYYNELFKLDYAPIAHEITHLIVPFYSSLSLREGLACLMQDTYGKNDTLFNFGAPVHSLAKQFTTTDYEKVIYSIGEEGIPIIDIKNTYRASFYILSYSFTKYLIDEYGIKKFMKIYDSDEIEKAYNKIYNKDLNQLKKDWLTFLSTQDDYEYTCQELLENSIIKELKK